jgi:hypothetical protein
MNTTSPASLEKKMPNQIDLNQARIPANSELLSGRDCGQEFRKRFRVDQLDGTDEEVIVTIPDEVISMNTSFFLGLFGPSVRKLGPERFLMKYQFQCDEVHLATVREGMSRAVKEGTIFGKRKETA